MEFKFKIIDLHEKWLREDLALKENKINSMQMAVLALDKNIPFTASTHNLDKRFIKIKKRLALTP